MDSLWCIVTWWLAIGGGPATDGDRTLELRKWMQARATLRHCLGASGVLVVRVLEGVGRTRRLVRV